MKREIMQSKKVTRLLWDHLTEFEKGRVKSHKRLANKSLVELLQLEFKERAQHAIREIILQLIKLANRLGFGWVATTLLRVSSETANMKAFLKAILTEGIFLSNEKQVKLERLDLHPAI
jgi:hypothetical protein